MTWGHKDHSEHVVRIHVLDRVGVPYRPPIVGQGAHTWNNTVDPGEADFDMDPDFPRAWRTDKMRLHITTYAEDGPVFTGRSDAPGPHRQGMGLYCVETFTPTPERWLYCLYPRVNGQLIRLRTTDGRHRVSVFGRCESNPNLDALVQDVKPHPTATWMAGATFHSPFVPA